MDMTPGTAALKAGTSLDFTLTYRALYGFQGPVSLSCSVSPKPVFAPTCVLNRKLCWKLGPSDALATVVVIVNFAVADPFSARFKDAGSAVRTVVPCFRTRSVGSRSWRMEREDNFRRYARPSCDNAVPAACLRTRNEHPVSVRHTSRSVSGYSQCHVGILGALNRNYDHRAVISHIFIPGTRSGCTQRLGVSRKPLSLAS